MFAIILDDLRKRFGEKILLRPEDLSAILGMTKGVQANRRSNDAFPIPIRRIGRNVVVTIYDLAQYLANVGAEEVKIKLADEKLVQNEKPTRSAKKAKKGLLEKGWWLFHVGNVIAILEQHPLWEATTGSGEPLPPRDPFKESM